jgi:hypothetical protein
MSAGLRKIGHFLESRPNENDKSESIQHYNWKFSCHAGTRARRLVSFHTRRDRGALSPETVRNTTNSDILQLPNSASDTTVTVSGTR